MEAINEITSSIKRIGIRKSLLQLLNFGTVLSSAFMSWKLGAWYMNVESPIVVVLSGSMEPAFFRGDLLFINYVNRPMEIGEIVVFKLPGREIPIVHRLMRIHYHKETDEEWLLTKGDNNNIDDRGLYDPGQMWLQRKHIAGRIYGHLPYVGMITIILNDYPNLKYAVLVVMAALAILNNEEQ